MVHDATINNFCHCTIDLKWIVKPLKNSFTAFQVFSLVFYFSKDPNSTLLVEIQSRVLKYIWYTLMLIWAYIWSGITSLSPGSRSPVINMYLINFILNLAALYSEWMTQGQETYRIMVINSLILKENDTLLLLNPFMSSNRIESKLKVAPGLYLLGSSKCVKHDYVPRTQFWKKYRINTYEINSVFVVILNTGNITIITFLLNLFSIISLIRTALLANQNSSMNSASEPSLAFS